jgi:hypothetical protein
MEYRKNQLLAALQTSIQVYASSAFFGPEYLGAFHHCREACHAMPCQSQKAWILSITPGHRPSKDTEASA